jgi:hypothetical protein
MYDIILKCFMVESLTSLHTIRNSMPRLIQVDIGGHPVVPTGSPCEFLVQHVVLYFFVIVGSTLSRLY